MNKKIISFCIICSMLCGCGLKNDDSSNIVLNYMENIYSLNNIEIYTNFSNLLIKINDEDFNIKSALEDNIIFYQNLIELMNYVDSLNDGGSKIYESNPQLEVNEHFYLVKCNTLNGNKNIIIGNNKDITNYCQYK